MRILCVGGTQYKSVAERFYNVMPKLVQGFIRSGHCVQLVSDRDLSRMSRFLFFRTSGHKGANKKFMKFVDAFQPDFIVMNHADIISSETLLTIQKKYPAIKMAQVNVDSLYNPENVERIRSKSGIVDANFITTCGPSLSKVAKDGKPAYYIPNPVDASIESGRAFENNNLENDLFFAAGDSSSENDRGLNLQDIYKHVPNIRFKFCVASEGTGLFGQEYIEELSKSLMGLNLSRFTQRTVSGEVDRNDYYLYSSDRISHYIGNGVLTLCDSAFSQQDLFRDDEIVCYNSNEDLFEKIAYYKNNPSEARAIAKKGWEKYHRDFNSTKVTQFIIDKVFNIQTTDYNWPER